MSVSPSIRIATYNIHKCRGIDGRVSPERVADVIRDTAADIIALQEVVRSEKQDQVALLAELAGFPHSCFGENRRHAGSPYGNALLSRLPVEHFRNYDLTMPRREPRGMLRADLRLANGNVLHVLNVHLGTGLMELRGQADRLLQREVLLSEDFASPTILLGDFNEWTRGLATRRLSEHFKSAERVIDASAAPKKRMRSYPGVLPVLHLDHIYYDAELKLRSFELHRSRKSLVASDHLPLVARFELV